MTYAHQWIPNIRDFAPLSRDDVEALYGPEAVRQIDEHVPVPADEVFARAKTLPELQRAIRKGRRR